MKSAFTTLLNLHYTYINVVITKLQLQLHLQLRYNYVLRYLTYIYRPNVGTLNYVNVGKKTKKDPIT